MFQLATNRQDGTRGRTIYAYRTYVHDTDSLSSPGCPHLTHAADPTLGYTLGGGGSEAGAVAGWSPAP